MIKKLFDAGMADRLIARARQELDLKTQNHLETWGLAQDGTWAANTDTGIITFTTGRGWIVTAPFQVIGTYDTLDKTWLWGWNHPSVSTDLAQDAWRARRFGDQHGLEAYTTSMISCTEQDAWTFTAIACHLSEAQGGYCGLSGTTSPFMTFGDLQFRQHDT